MKYMFVLGAFVIATIAITEARSDDFSDRIEAVAARIADLDEPTYTINLTENPTAGAVVSINRVGDDAFETAGFSIGDPATFRVIALGEGVGNTMYDYAWITDATSRRTVWSMDYASTHHAGGARKNRIEDATITLAPGSYLVHYASDGSHSYDDWNSSRPLNASLWGVTVVPVGEVQTESYTPSDADVVAQIVRVRDSQQRRTRFTLDTETSVNIYALGEGTGNTMYDYAALRNEQGSLVWRMDYGSTEWAGGARKNRMETRTLTLPAGTYSLEYRTDGSHAFGDWNDAPPADQAHWGVSLYRAVEAR